MSLKDELKAKLLEEKAKLLEKKKQEDEAKKQEEIRNTKASKVFIEEFISPKFKKIAEKNPTLEVLRVSLFCYDKEWHCRENLSEWDVLGNFIYPCDVVIQAVKVAREYDMHATYKKEDDGGISFLFCLDLRD